jgi:hypothetical protein
MLAGVNTEDQIILKVFKFNYLGKNGNSFYVRQALMNLWGGLCNIKLILL